MGNGSCGFTAWNGVSYLIIKSALVHYFGDLCIQMIVIKARTLAIRSLRGSARERQSNNECSVSSTPSFVGHIGFMVSLKQCMNL